MAETTGLTKRQRRMWLRILVIVSLTLNLLFIGLVAGTFARVGPPMPPPPPSVGAAMFKAMPPDDRKEIRERMRGTRDMHRDERHASEAEAVLAALSAEPFDAEALRQVVLSQAQSRFEEISAAQSDWVDRVAGMSDSEREAFVGRMQQIIAEAAEKRSKGWFGDKDRHGDEGPRD